MSENKSIETTINKFENKSIETTVNEFENKSIKTTVNEFENNICSICLDNIGKIDIMITKCNHVFCASCMLKHSKISDTCPLCRTVLIEQHTTVNKSNIDTYSLEDILMNYPQIQHLTNDLQIQPPTTNDPEIQSPSLQHIADEIGTAISGSTQSPPTNDPQIQSPPTISPIQSPTTSGATQSPPTSNPSQSFSRSILSIAMNILNNADELDSTNDSQIQPPTTNDPPNDPPNDIQIQSHLTNDPQIQLPTTNDPQIQPLSLGDIIGEIGIALARGQLDNPSQSHSRSILSTARTIFDNDPELASVLNLMATDIINNSLRD